MQDSFQPQPPVQPYPYQSPGYPPPRRGGSKVLLWVLIGVGSFFALACGGCFFVFMYVGMQGPETSVYPGNRVPNRYREIMKEVGALEEDEEILYFYSDGLADIRDGFYFVSDKKVVVYIEGAGDSPLTVVRFDEIADMDLYREESFFEDSQITLELKDGRTVSFPVSSEVEGDQRFFDAIQQRVEKVSAVEPPPEGV
jgi:hypothetical protein